MSNGIGWDEIDDPKTNNGGGDSSDLFLKLSDGTHTVRLVGKPVVRYTAWIGKRKYVVPEEYINRLAAIDITARKTYAINVFDRADTAAGKTRFKILERGASVFSPFGTYFKEVIDEETGKNVDPGGKDGPNWKIIVSVPPGDKRRTTYKVMAMPKSSPFTKAEAELIRRPKTMTEEELKKLPLGERGLIDLERFYDLNKAKEELDKVLAAGGTGTADEGDDLDVASASMSGSEDTEDELTAKASTSAGPVSNGKEDDLDDMIANAF